jgi:hypothetical protein
MVLPWKSIRCLLQAFQSIPNTSQLLEGEGALDPASGPFRSQPDDEFANQHTGIPIPGLAFERPADFQHIRMSAQVVSDLLQLGRSFPRVSHLEPPSGGFHVEGIWRLQRLNRGPIW